ncbi:MAG: PilN domain-containing protein [Ardenticatenaceae bacterium]|nr:PilN domain-containing protein [Ardenticatenaceae bacterium]
MISRDSTDVDDILNNLQPAAPSRRPLILWLLVLGLLILLLPLYLIFTTINSDAVRLEAELSNIQLASASEPTADPTTEALQAELTQVQEQFNQINAIQASLDTTNVNWPAVVAALQEFDPARQHLTSLTQTENRLTITGEAADDALVIAYAQRLEASGLFNRVVVQSITLLPTPQATATLTPTQTATATATPAPTQTSESGSGGSGGSTPFPTITLTPDYRDEFEVDDGQPVPIFIGQAQPRNFFPNFDVDNASFLAKSGRYYRVLTSNLAPGVDTFLTVTIGDVVLPNDDSKPGTLASEMAFQVPGGDIEVLIQVTNRGQYGPGMSYQLLVEEILPTAVPTTTAPDTTNTPQPTATLTPTPNLHDAYEPDDQTPAAIAIGETQAHNFYPTNDIDKITFLTKAGRFYQAATANLALGVDTFMQAEFNGQQWQNDDYALPGSGNFASAVCFPTATDGTAVITTTNKMAQYGPGNVYNIGVVEVPALFLGLDQLAFGPVVAGGSNPPTQTVSISGDTTVAWTAVAPSNWLHISPTSGNAPAWLNVTADISGLPPGSYQDVITFSWASLCRRTISVTLQVEAPLSSQIEPLTPHAPIAWGQNVVAHHRDYTQGKQVTVPGTAVAFIILVELKDE